jgi:hypothetical protein
MDHYSILLDFKDVFPKEFLGLPPKREIDSNIEIKPSAEPIYKTLYRMIVP